MRFKQIRNDRRTLICAFLVVIAAACNSVAGIESGRLGLCPDGSRTDTTNCDDAGAVGGGGSWGHSSSTSTGGASATCAPPWQRRNSAGRQCYVQEYTFRDWASAEQRCVDLGGHLAALDSAAELAELGEWIVAEVWIGGTDQGHEGSFVWTNGQLWSFASWKDGGPMDPSGNRDCVALTTTIGSLPVFEARMCSEKRPYVCESSAANP